MKILYEGQRYGVGIKDRYNYCVVDLKSAQNTVFPNGASGITYQRQWFYNDIGGAVHKISRIAADDGSVDLMSWLDKYKEAVKQIKEGLNEIKLPTTLLLEEDV